MAGSTNGDANDDWLANIARAQGVVSRQAECTVEEALLWMQARARANRVSVGAIARAVLDGRIRFDD